MLFTAQVKSDQQSNSKKELSNSASEINLTDLVSRVRSKIPAVTHVDMSARIQTVDKHNPLHQVLLEYEKITNVPVLINTSFNVRNEPIVESPEDALRCFMTTDIDALVIEGFLLLKSEQPNHVKEYWKNKEFEGELD